MHKALVLGVVLMLAGCASAPSRARIDYRAGLYGPPPVYVPPSWFTPANAEPAQHFPPPPTAAPPLVALPPDDACVGYWRICHFF